MGERKVLNKYFPPDFDPALIPKVKMDKDHQMKIRMMLPMSVRCKTCGNFMYKGTKFNSRKEDVHGKNYLGIQIYRFYFRCANCSAEYTILTDPKNSDYTVESGASRNYEPWREEEESKKLSQQEREEEERGNAIKALENRQLDSKREMDVLSALDELRSLNARKQKLSFDQVLSALKRSEREEAAEAARERKKRAQPEGELDPDDEEAIRRLFYQQRAKLQKTTKEDDSDDAETPEKDTPVTSKLAPKPKTVGEDPGAKIDTFGRLTAKQRRIWQGSRISLQQLREKLQSIQMVVVVDVVPIGFDGSGAQRLTLPKQALPIHLQHLPDVLTLRSLGFPDDTTRSNATIDVKIVLTTYPARTGALERIESAIASAMQRYSRRVDLMVHDMDLVTIPYRVVDEVLQEEYIKGRMLPTVYLLNPKLPYQQHYGYHYEAALTDGCPGNFWISTEGPKGSNYMWVDISAGPLKYGPRHLGAGQVMEHSFPRLESYPAKTLNRAIVPDISAMIHSILQHILMPQTLSLELPEWSKMVIQIIHLHDAMVPDVTAMHVAEQDEILEQLQDLALTGQSIEMFHYYVAFGQCDSCTAAFSEALLTETHRIPGDKVLMTETEFLDSLVLHAWLSNPSVQDSILDNHNVHIPLKNETPGVRVVPVFVLELARMDTMTFERGKQAVGFSDLILAVRTHGGHTLSDTACGSSGMPIHGANISRPLLAALLQTGWGVVETSEIWSPARGRVHDYRWNVGPTPFGVLTGVQTLPHAIQRTAQRNTLLSAASRRIQSGISLYTTLQKLSPLDAPSELFEKKQLEEFYQRSNVLRSKLTVGLMHCGRGEFDTGYYYIQSSQHDLSALLMMLNGLRDTGPQPVLVCLHKRGRLNFWLIFGLGVILAVVFWVLRMMRPVKTKIF